ncbi:MAG: hypothetical protein ACQESG_05120 [Nanobdellota archaeon]
MRNVRLAMMDAHTGDHRVISLEVCLERIDFVLSGGFLAALEIAEGAVTIYRVGQALYCGAKPLAKRFRHVLRSVREK